MNVTRSSRHFLNKKGKGETQRLAAQLAPLEDQNQVAADAQSPVVSVSRGANQEVGAIVIDNTPAHLSPDISDVRQGRTFMGMEPVTLVILVGMLLFIVFITWQITLMPIEE